MHKPIFFVLLAAAAVCIVRDAVALSEPTIDSITFTGNLPVSEDDLLRGSGLHHGVSIFMVSSNQVRDAVRSNMISQGYLDCTVSVSWPRWGSESYDVEITVFPGRQSLRGSLFLYGDNLLSSDQLEELFPASPGEPVSPSDTASFKLAVLGRYSALGYLRASAEIELERFLSDSSDNRRDVTVILDRGDICYLGGITVEGNSSVREKVILREFDLAPGDPMNMDKMRSGLSSLYGLGLFDGVQIEYSGIVQGEDTIDVVLSVAEMDYIEIDLASGYISPEAVFGSAYWIQPNIMGNNQLLKLGGVYTRYISKNNSGNEFEPQVVYEEPWFLSTRWRSQIKLDYYYLQRD
jgi:outer membrane protein assembly factor BamA